MHMGRCLQTLREYAATNANVKKLGQESDQNFFAVGKVSLSRSRCDANGDSRDERCDPSVDGAFRKRKLPMRLAQENGYGVSVRKV